MIFPMRFGYNPEMVREHAGLALKVEPEWSAPKRALSVSVGRPTYPGGVLFGEPVAATLLDREQVKELAFQLQRWLDATEREVIPVGYDLPLAPDAEGGEVPTPAWAPKNGDLRMIDGGMQEWCAECAEWHSV